MDSDRLSELPDSLILEILSLLPMDDVVSTMLLSKRWLHLWTTVSSLDFKSIDKTYKYKEFVSGALANWKGSKIHKFSSYVDYKSVYMVDSWLLFAMEKQVEELICYNSSHGKYCPPQRLYSCSSIIKMSLTFCNLRIDEAVQWNRLKSLEIEDVYSLSEDAMDRILAGAPLLEELILGYFLSDENLNIRSVSLKILKLGLCDDIVYDKTVRVWAPNLLDLEISGGLYGTFLLDVPSLTNAVICFQDSHYALSYDVRIPPNETFRQVFQSIRHVEKLKLLELNNKPLLSIRHNFEFPNVKSLSFYTARPEEMLGILHMFPNLTTLRVQHGAVFVSHLSKADLPNPSLPFLKRVEISWFMCDISIIPALEILLENAKLLDKMVCKANWYLCDGDKPEMLLSKPASSPTAEVTIIHV